MSMPMKTLARLLLAAALCLSLQGWAAAPDEEDAPPVGVVPRYVLQGPGGGPVTDSDFRGRFQLITFGYTYCPDVCPTTLMEMAQVLKRLGRDASRLQALFVSVDPERDTPALLKEYTGFFDKRILGLTGSPQLLRRVADLFKVRYETVREPGAAHGQYAVDHSAGMYLLGPDGGFIVKFGYGAAPDEVAERIRKLMAETRPSPARR